MGPKFFSWVFCVSNIFFVVILWVQIFFVWVFRDPKFFSQGYFVGPKLFFVGSSCFQHFFSWLFCWSEFFSLGYFVGLKLFLVGISCVQFFFMANFMIQRFSVAGCMKNNDREQKYRNTSQTTYSFLNQFQQLSIVYIRKALHLLNYLRCFAAFICTMCIFRHLIS